MKSVRSHNDDSCDDTGDVDSSGDVLGIVKTLYFDFSDGECKENGDNLQECLVTIENTQGNVTTL